MALWCGIDTTKSKAANLPSSGPVTATESSTIIIAADHREGKTVYGTQIQASATESTRQTKTG